MIKLLEGFRCGDAGDNFNRFSFLREGTWWPYIASTAAVRFCSGESFRLEREKRKKIYNFS